MWAKAAEINDCRPLSRARGSRSCSWGSRPRLYAVACLRRLKKVNQTNFPTLRQSHHVSFLFVLVHVISWIAFLGSAAIHAPAHEITPTIASAAQSLLRRRDAPTNQGTQPKIEDECSDSGLQQRRKVTQHLVSQALMPFSFYLSDRDVLVPVRLCHSHGVLHLRVDWMTS